MRLLTVPVLALVAAAGCDGVLSISDHPLSPVTAASDGAAPETDAAIARLSCCSRVGPSAVQWAQGVGASQPWRVQKCRIQGVTPTIAVACVQNGVENERLALRHVADVYAVCVMLPASHLEPGIVEVSSIPTTGLLDLGRYPDGIDDRAHAIAGALSTSTFESIPRPDVMRMKYCKLLMNLVNAAQAFAEDSCDTNEVVISAAALEQSDAIVVSVRDNGPGIAPADLPRVFDPFFTTKAIGVGTGLGLSICHGIVTSMGGQITLESVLGVGTIVRVLLPTRPASTRSAR